MTNLLPCPHCDGECRLHSYFVDSSWPANWVGCPACEYGGPNGDSKAQAIALHNAMPRTTPLRNEGIADTGDVESVCSVCGLATDEPHTAKQCFDVASKNHSDFDAEQSQEFARLHDEVLRLTKETWALGTQIEELHHERAGHPTQWGAWIPVEDGLPVCEDPDPERECYFVATSDNRIIQAGFFTAHGAGRFWDTHGTIRNVTHYQRIAMPRHPGEKP